MPFSYVGRMALTNYLLQSLICTTIFYSYGLGLYGRVGPLADFFLGVAIYGPQVPLSRWWLSTHRYGPMEWLWRRLTYGRIAASDCALLRSLPRHCFRSSLIFFSALSRTSFFRSSGASASFGSISSAFSA